MTKIVDIHSHVILDKMLNEAGPYGPRLEVTDDGDAYFIVGDYRLRRESIASKALGRKPTRAETLERMAKAADPKVRLQNMDTLGIDVLGVTISPLVYFYWIEPDLGAHYATVANDALAEYVATAPDRYFFMATLPLQDMDASVAELERAVSIGARGINIGGGDIAGRELYDEYFWPLYERAEDAGLPFLIHPYPFAMNGRKSTRFTPVMLDYPIETTEAVANIILGGVLDRFPGLKFCITHGGGFIPYQFGRIELHAQLKREVACSRPPREYMKSFYSDILIHDPMARRFLVDWMGADNLVLGDNHAGHDSVSGVEMVKELNLEAAVAEKILGGNAIRLFNLN